jgi:hypothetical protein
MRGACRTGYNRQVDPVAREDDARLGKFAALTDARSQTGHAGYPSGEGRLAE